MTSKSQKEEKKWGSVKKEKVAESFLGLMKGINF